MVKINVKTEYQSNKEKIYVFVLGIVIGAILITIVSLSLDKAHEGSHTAIDVYTVEGTQ